jgi:hypothetical protein
MPKLRAGWGCQDVLTPFTTDPQALRLEPILVLKLSLKVFPGFVIIGREPLLSVVEVWRHIPKIHRNCRCIRTFIDQPPPPPSREVQPSSR